MDTEKLLGRMQQLQQLLNRVLACRPSGAAKHNRLILIALYPVVKESFQLYADISDVLAAILDRFFDMEYQECGKAFEAYATAAKQIDELCSFYGWCKDTGVARSSEYPDVQRIADQLLGTLEGFMRDRASRPKSPQREPVVSRPVREEEGEEKPPLAEDLNSIRALPAPDDYKEEEPKPEPEIEKPVPVAPAVPTKQQGDLVDLREDSATADEQGNKLALALFSGPAAAVASGTGSDGSWEAFPSDGDAEATSAWETPAAEPGKADWELALVETASGLSKQKAALGGGFDPLLLNGMYDQGTVRQHAAAQASGSGSASSAALPAPGLRRGAQVLALPAPDGTVQVIGGDPFVASLSVPPPAYVQMAEMEKKQQLLVQEQHVWMQFQRDGMQGQVSSAKLDNGSGYGFVPNPAVLYKMPVGYNGAVYSYTTY
uniref:AP180 N-terminal homology (ANTH) domain-containing protein n=1 Tax=Ananas comosus var. bracteatus TaxID=296719 RepID=A0A6V7PDA7_ANACO|nr:unnamed protein product [Ananas comosus var. bracteatus]